MKIYNIFGFGMTGKIAILMMSAIGAFTPIKLLAIAVIGFILADFVVGLVVSVRVRKQGLISKKVWRTVWKLIGAEICIILAWVMDTHVLTFLPTMFLPNIFAGIVCGADLWSILTNFAILSDHPAFRLIKKWGKTEIQKKIGMDISELDNLKSEL